MGAGLGRVGDCVGGGGVDGDEGRGNGVEVVG